MIALKDALDVLRPFAEVSLLAAYQSLPEGQYFDLHFADGDEACFNAFTVADLRRVAAAVEAIEKMMGVTDHKCFECGTDLTVVCLRCNPLADAPPPPAGDMVLVPRDDTKRSFADPLLPREMVAAGEDAIDKAHEDLQNYVSGKTIDWDSGMIAVAVCRQRSNQKLVKPCAPLSSPPSGPERRVHKMHKLLQKQWVAKVAGLIIGLTLSSPFWMVALVFLLRRIHGW